MPRSGSINLKRASEGRLAKSIIELAATKRGEPDWIIEGFLKRGGVGIMMGQPKKAAKSWLTLDMCWSLTEGKCLWGIQLLTPPRPMRVVYFTQEDTEDDAQDRVLAHLAGAGRAANDRLWVVPKNLAATLDTGEQWIHRELEQVAEKAGGIDLVAFDPMRRMHHGDENDSQTIAKLWAAIDRIHRAYGCATWFTHHTVKPPQDKKGFDPTDPFSGRGSSDIYGGGDAFVVVVPGTLGADGQSRKVGLYFESKRGKQLAPVMLKVSFTTGQVELLGAAWEHKPPPE